MRGIIFITFCLSGIFFEVSGQNFSYPVIKETRKNITDFIPKDWTLLEEAKGDLNKDGLEDFAIVIQYKDSVEEQDTTGYWTNSNPRMLIIDFNKVIK